MDCGFLEQELSGVCMILNKLDKVGANGVQKELEEKSYHVGAIEKLMQLLEQMPGNIDEIARFCKDTEAVDGGWCMTIFQMKKKTFT